MYFLRRWQRSIATATSHSVDIASLINSLVLKVATRNFGNFAIYYKFRFFLEIRNIKKKMRIRED